MIISDLKASVPEDDSVRIRYPGERVIADRKLNLERGIPVSRTVWEEILGL
jgi:LDH2 family malate/lactate/ureidoglycolate dehydrogenase